MGREQDLGVLGEYHGRGAVGFRDHAVPEQRVVPVDEPRPLERARRAVGVHARRKISRPAQVDDLRIFCSLKDGSASVGWRNAALFGRKIGWVRRR